MPVPLETKSKSLLEVIVKSVPSPDMVSPESPNSIVLFAAKTTLSANVKAPVLSPDIHVVVVDPSCPDIFNCLSPVALSANTLPIITLPSPDVIFSPAPAPTPVL